MPISVPYQGRRRFWRGRYGMLAGMLYWPHLTQYDDWTRSRENNNHTIPEKMEKASETARFAQNAWTGNEIFWPWTPTKKKKEEHNHFHPHASHFFVASAGTQMNVETEADLAGDDFGSIARGMKHVIARNGRSITVWMGTNATLLVSSVLITYATLSHAVSSFCLQSWAHT